jgi:hypothetical protein
MIFRRKRGDKRAQATAALTEMVGRGAIVSFETNFESRKAGEPYRVTVVVKTADVLRRERIWLQVRKALESLGAGVEMRMERIRGGP